ncbi:hypothetical protein MBLNU230_g7978t1 [Neophaeotheca triangularis]
MPRKRSASPGPSTESKKARAKGTATASGNTTKPAPPPGHSSWGTARKRVLEAAARTPRFLFRGFHAGSGGDPALNTTEAITPKAFLNRKGPSTLFDLSTGRVAALATGHFNGSSIDTVFSSWSQSIAVALGFAELSPSMRNQDSYLAVIDTKRLPIHNVVISTTLMDCIQEGIPSTPEEYMVFGLIKGEAFRAVPMDQIVGLASSPMTGGFYKDPLDFQVIQSVSALFGPQFHVPVSIALTMGAKDERAIDSVIDRLFGVSDTAATDRMAEKLVNYYIERGFSEFREWSGDETIMSPSFEVVGCRYMVRVLRTLVKKMGKIKEQAAKGEEEEKKKKNKAREKGTLESKRRVHEAREKRLERKKKKAEKEKERRRIQNIKARAWSLRKQPQVTADVGQLTGSMGSMEIGVVG